MSGYQHTAKFSREMKKKFFSVCVDDFFLDPDKIREWGLSLDKNPSHDGAWPGVRSDELFKVNDVVNQHIICKILSAYFDMSYVNFGWTHSNACFQQIPKMSVNEGWVHQDTSADKGDIDLAGLIYLTPDADPNGGTSLMRVKPEYKNKLVSKTNPEKHFYYTGGEISDEDYTAALKRNNDKFYETVRFQNIYNRLIIYDAQEFHRANSFDVGDSDRLTLVFFIGGINSDTLLPRERVVNEDFDATIESAIKLKTWK
tara:strand:+ start:55 stop:825 length:771 start_codon:yes stop_codon:yes gene_type:complete